MDSKGCNFAGSDVSALHTLNSPALQGLVFPDTIIVDPGFKEGEKRLKFCKEIIVMLDKGRDLKALKT